MDNYQIYLEGEARKRKRNKLLIVIPLAILAVIILLSAVFSDSPSTGAATQTSANRTAAPEETKTLAPNIVSSADVFVDRFNDFTSRNDMDLSIADISFTEGDVPMFKYFFNDNLGLLGVLNKEDRSVTSITIMSSGGGDGISTGVNILTAMGGLFTAIDPSITPDERGAIIKKLGILEKGNIKDGYKKRVIVKGIKYWITVSETLGVWFGAELPDKEKATA